MLSGAGGRILLLQEPGFFEGNVEMWRALKAAALAARQTTRSDGGFFHSPLWKALNLDG